MDYSKGSMIIEQNVFRGSGIVITSAEDTTINIENNQFVGDYQRPVLVFSNTLAVSLRKNNFENLKVSDDYLKYDRLASAILCYNSSIKLLHSSFKDVTLNTIISLENCSMEMMNVTLLENTRCSSCAQQVMIEMINSQGNFSN